MMNFVKTEVPTRAKQCAGKKRQIFFAASLSQIACSKSFLFGFCWALGVEAQVPRAFSFQPQQQGWATAVFAFSTCGFQKAPLG